MENDSIYIVVRLDIESTEQITDELKDEIVSQCDYNFQSKTVGVEIESTEICGINWD